MIETANKTHEHLQQGRAGGAYVVLNALNKFDGKKKKEEETPFEVELLYRHFKAIGNEEHDVPDEFRDILNQTVPDTPTDPSLGAPPSNDGIMKTVKNMRANAAADPEGMQTQLLKYAGGRVKRLLCDIVRAVWTRPEKCPGGWLGVKVLPIWKGKGLP